jgi:hypothetical protein
MLEMIRIATIVLVGLLCNCRFTFAANGKDKIAGCYIVSFKNNLKSGKNSASENAQAFVSAQANVKAFAKSLGKITAEYDKAVKGFTVCGVNSELQLNSIRNNSFVASVEQDRVIYANALRTVVNPLSWGLDRIDQRTSALDAIRTMIL